VWMQTRPDGTTQEYWRGKIGVDPDGSMRLTDNGNPAVKTTFRLDGSSEIDRGNGRIEYRNIDYSVESRRLEALAKQEFPNAKQAERFTTLMQSFEANAKARNLSRDEVGNVYHQI